MMKVKGRHAILSLVLFTFGFLIAFSYQHTKSLPKDDPALAEDWDKTFYYRQQLIQFEENNHQLQQEIDQVRLNLLQLENEMVEQVDHMRDMVDEKLTLQAYTGELPIKGPGIFVSLKDQEFIPTEAQIDEYIVHDRHIQMVINELIVSGAEALAINGQRIFADSHITCIGPVISVDGNQYPAPFVIEAIGDPDTLKKSLEISNGIIDILVNEQIEVEIGKKNDIKMSARMS
ncbi:DUF881 domain-containing protein [Amphibacillus xylanus]|uniref:DUF881 domain-containing protein n=1 Tax=Amphibacillus xylanus (strain ATCC 51415 / DSM 6626 / JCM 7361 / LMG 17667 / NBRC 15112 / Ep01) TaxID=698758 RepID=K0IYU9_AMPXN|nr:DUF881 domain-containing protein [Amphibacillus xylanus]BAM47715.1 hypothetical protein AXY_15830 [Amphibacillus xylanus NBRC 15112]